MNDLSAHRASIATLLCSLAISCCLTVPAALAGETCLNAPTPSDWDRTGGALPLEVGFISSAPNDPTCALYIPLDEVLNEATCEGWIGKTISNDSVEVEHHLLVDSTGIWSSAGSELVIFEASRSGQPEPTIQIAILHGRDPQLRVSWNDDESSGSQDLDLSPTLVHELEIRWRASNDGADGFVEVWVDQQKSAGDSQLQLELMRPDSFRVGVLGCDPSLIGGNFKFAPLATRGARP